MAINAMLNSLSGPEGQYFGASTMRPRQNHRGGAKARQERGLSLIHGGEIGSTAGERYGFCSVWYHRHRAILIVANDNYSEARLAA